MDRRQFIQAGLGTVALAMIPATGDGVALRSMAHPTTKDYEAIANKMAENLAASLKQMKENVAARVFLDEDNLVVEEIEIADLYEPV